MDPLSVLQSQRTDIQTHSFGWEDISNTSKIHFSKYDGQNETYLDWDIYTYTYMKRKAIRYRVYRYFWNFLILRVSIFLEFCNTYS